MIVEAGILNRDHCVLQVIRDVGQAHDITVCFRKCKLQNPFSLLIADIGCRLPGRKGDARNIRRRCHQAVPSQIRIDSRSCRQQDEQKRHQLQQCTEDPPRCSSLRAGTEFFLDSASGIVVHLRLRMFLDVSTGIIVN